MKERALEKAFKKTYFGDKISLNSDIGEAFKLGYKLAKKQNKTSVDYLLNLIVGEDAEGKPMLVKNVIDDLEIIKYKELFQQETLEDAIRKEYKFRIGSHSFSNPLNIGGQQERMYSEEDMKEAFSMGRTGKTIEDFNIKFKNK